MYRVTISGKALRQLEKLEKIIQKRIYSALKRLEIRPERYIKKLTGKPYFSLRVGDYRVILEVYKKELSILAIKIGHRRNVYKKL